MRSGIIAKKLGMTRLFMDDGKQIPVTVLQLDGLQVVSQRTADKHGYSAVQLGTGTIKAKRVSQAMRGHFAVAQVEPKRKVAEFQANNPTFAPVLDVFERMEITRHGGEYLDWFEPPNYMRDIHHWDLALTEYNLGPEGSAEALGAVCNHRRSLGGMLLFVYEPPRRFCPESLPL